MKTYLGDGLYAEDHGFQIRLFTPEGNEVYLDAQVLYAFFEFVSESRGLDIKIKSKTKEDV